MNTDEIRAALAAATPGPWHAWDRGIGYEVHEGATHGESNGDSAWCRELNNEFRETFRSEDAHLIANAPTWLAELLAEVDRLAARAEAAEQAVRRVRELHAPMQHGPKGQRTICVHCFARYPCPTIRALDGGE